MNGLTIATLMIMAAVVAWGFTKAHASARHSRFRADVARRERELLREIQHCRDEADRARSHAAQVSRDAETWVAGCRQGREDVISVMPLLMAAHEGTGEACRRQRSQQVTERA
ncbi:MAG TPA: hypothetical protein VMI33_03125 [Streptosporangiaceae bacterium]|nr:hypothetical protein [Streptosporangiaceae bacterium]